MLSFKSQFWHGLRVNPTFEQVIGTVDRPLRVPLPDRRAKFYANGPYRALILDAAKAFHQHAGAVTDYDASGAKLPAAAAMIGATPEDAEQERRMRMQQDAQARQYAAEVARAQVAQLRQSEARQIRAQHLSAHHHPNTMDPVVMTEHEDLEESGVPHAFPAPGVPPLKSKPRVAHEQWAAQGIPQAPEFPTYESLNEGQPTEIRQATLTPSQHATYEQLREQAQHTWSS